MYSPKQFESGDCALYNSDLLGSLIGMFGLVHFSRSVVSDSLRPHGLQPARPPCPSPTPGVPWFIFKSQSFANFHIFTIIGIRLLLT